MSNFWLMKSEPDAFSIDDLKSEKTSLWDGIRNYQARNFMMNDMKKGDLILFYHSNSKPSGVIGLAEVFSSKAVPDVTAQDPKSKYYDPKASPEKPIWYCVKVRYRKKFKQIISLQDLKENPKLKDMLVVKRGQRLSIQPVSEEHFNEVLYMANRIYTQSD